MPHLVDLHAYNREVVHFAILVRSDVCYLQKLAGSRSAAPAPSAAARPLAAQGRARRSGLSACGIAADMTAPGRPEQVND
jgi:hypothetical protein